MNECRHLTGLLRWPSFGSWPSFSIIFPFGPKRKKKKDNEKEIDDYSIGSFFLFVVILCRFPLIDGHQFGG